MKKFALLFAMLALAAGARATITDLSMTAQTTTSITLGWTSSGSIKNDFVTYSKGSPCVFDHTESTLSNCATSHTVLVTRLVPGTLYCFKVGGTNCSTNVKETSGTYQASTVAFTPTPTFTATLSSSPTPTSTPTPSISPSPTKTGTPTATPTASPTISPTPQATYVPTVALWATPGPATVSEAINRLAAKVNALNLTTPIP